MERMDDLLEQCLRRLDAGEPVERVVASLAPEEAELATLLRTAALARGANHAALDPLKAEAQRGRVVRSARDAKSNRSSRKLAWALVPAGALGLAAFAFLLVLAAVLVFGGPGSARAAILTDVRGVVEVAPSSASQDWSVAEEGDEVREGQVVRTRLGSSVALVYFEGSRTTLLEDTAVELQNLGGSWGRALELRLNQISGETSHSVVKLRGSGAYYQVITPAGQAEVYGTTFGVDVVPADGVLFSVDQGRVAVSQQGATVFLTAGQVTSVNADSEPGEPAYSFYVQGPLQAIDGSRWTVAGVLITVEPPLGTGFLVGDLVTVRGRVREDGSFFADRVAYAKDQHTRLRFTGLVDSLGETTWVIGGKTVQVNAETEIDSGLEVGDVVSVSYVILEDGSWLAKDIEALDKEDDEATPEPTLTDTPEPSETVEVTETVEATATAEVTGTPEASETPTVTATPEPTLEGNRSGCENGEWQHPRGLSLAARWGVSYNEIMRWFCQGYGFGEIDLAYELAQQSGLPVEEVFAMRASGMGWGNIKKALEQQNPGAPDTKGPGKPPREPNPNKRKP